MMAQQPFGTLQQLRRGQHNDDTSLNWLSRRQDRRRTDDHYR
jgi:hypothetical protein